MVEPHRSRTFRPANAGKPIIALPKKAAPTVLRPKSPLLTSLIRPDNVVRLDLPHGCFNAGLAEIPDRDELVCVYRADEQTFVGCLLDKSLQVIKGSEAPLGITNCADPRLVWVQGSLLMVYSSYDTGSYKTECIRGAVIGDIRGTFGFHRSAPFRISLPGESRQKNWMPFVNKGQVFLVASVKPHLVYELSGAQRFAQPCSEFEWEHPWFSEEFMRGNTNAVQLDDGNMLGTFHTVQRDGKMHYYDNGCYVFEPHPPFRVLRCSNRTFLPAEAAVEPHFRKAGLIKVCFPVGMVRKGDDLLISYGDNDSSVKILKTTVADMLATTVDVY